MGIKNNPDSFDVYMTVFDELSFGEYFIDIAAGFEYCFIKVFDPDWNKDGKTKKLIPS